MPNRRLPLGPALIALLLGLPAAAAEAPRPAASVTGARYEDWTLVCAEGCRIATEVASAEGEPRVLLRLWLEAPAAEGAPLVLETPLPLFLPDGLTLAVGADEPRELAWRTCGAGTCEARLPLDPALRAALRRERSATAAFTLVDGTRVRLPLSLMGFTAAERAAR